MSSVVIETTATEATTESRMSRDDAQRVVNQLNDCQRRYDASKSEKMQGRIKREMSNLHNQLTLGDRITYRDEQRTREPWRLVLTVEEQAEDYAFEQTWKLDSIRRTLDEAKAKYRREVQHMMERLQRELANADNDYYQDANSAYGWSGAHDLPVLLERIAILKQLLAYADKGEWRGW